MTKPYAVLALMVDFSKAFNRSDHHTLITILSDMGVPKWLLKIVIAFLSERELIVKYKGGKSNKKNLPGGTPQGTRLGMFLFLVLINFAGFSSEDIEVNIGKEITKMKNKRNPMMKTHMKYIDDLTLATAIELKTNLVENVDPNIPRPLSYHERTLHLLPNDRNVIQQEFNRLQIFPSEIQMVINKEKTKSILFNPEKHLSSSLK